MLRLKAYLFTVGALFVGICVVFGTLHIMVNVIGPGITAKLAAAAALGYCVHLLAEDAYKKALAEQED